MLRRLCIGSGGTGFAEAQRVRPEVWLSVLISWYHVSVKVAFEQWLLTCPLRMLKCRVLGIPVGQRPDANLLLPGKLR